MVNNNNSHSFHTPLQYGWFSLVLTHITLACPAEMGVERSQGECVGCGLQPGCRFTAVMCWGWECAGLELTLHIPAYPVVSYVVIAISIGCLYYIEHDIISIKLLLILFSDLIM